MADDPLDEVVGRVRESVTCDCGDHDELVCALGDHSVTIGDLRQLLAAYQSLREDKARLDWLDTEEQRVDRVLAICVKRNLDRNSNEWAEAFGPVRATIDAARPTPTEPTDV